MQTINRSYRSLGLLIELNWDRALFTGTIALGLLAGAYIAAL
ncbi:MAG: hypothetical protein P1U53_07560 [Sulfitobacter sp.]|nr:hypothetical protein [Sulfitobacter sp.]